MKIYRYCADSNNFASVDFKPEHRNMVDSFFDGSSKAKTWKPIELVMDSSQGLLGDFPSLQSTIPILSAKAWTCSRKLVGDTAEALPVLIGGETFYAINVLKVIEGVDVGRSEVRRFSNGEIAEVKRYCWRARELEGLHLFKLKETMFGEVLLSDRFVELVAENGLKGLRAKLLPDVE